MKVFELQDVLQSYYENKVGWDTHKNDDVIDLLTGTDGTIQWLGVVIDAGVYHAPFPVHCMLVQGEVAA